MGAILIPLMGCIQNIKDTKKEKSNIFAKLYYNRLKKKALRLIDKLTTVDAGILQEFISLLEASPRRGEQIKNAYLDKDTGLFILDFFMIDEELGTRYNVSLKTSLNKISIDIESLNMKSGQQQYRKNFYAKDALVNENTANTDGLLPMINDWVIFLIKDFLTLELEVN